MAKPSNALIGRTRGSIGNATFTVWKGINVLKEKAQNAYTDPTPEQLLNNEKFATIVAFFKTFMMYIAAGFQGSAIGMTVYNAFMKANPYSTSVTGTIGATKMATNLLSVSKGSEEIPINPTKSAQNANSLEVNWNPNANPSIDSDNQMFGLAFNRTTGLLIASTSSTTWGDTALFLEATGIGTNIATTDVYIFYVNALNGKSCDSQLVASA